MKKNIFDFPHGQCDKHASTLLLLSFLVDLLLYSSSIYQQNGRDTCNEILLPIVPQQIIEQEGNQLILNDFLIK